MAEMHSELHRHILDVFNEFGVQIMTPAYEGDPKEPKLVPQAHWFDAPADGFPTARRTPTDPEYVRQTGGPDLPAAG